MLSTVEIKELFVNAKAILTDTHVVYTSGKHGSAYVNKDAIYPHTTLTSTLCFELAKQFEQKSIDAVLAPALGGIILSQWIAFHLSQLTNREVLGVYAEKLADNSGFEIKRGYDALIRDKNVLVVEDILTTGGSVKKVIEVVRKIPANIVGVAALCNRGGISATDLGAETLYSLLSVDLQTWEAADCPLCKKGIAINTSVGKGKK